MKNKGRADHDPMTVMLNCEVKIFWSWMESKTGVLWLALGFGEHSKNVTTKPTCASHGKGNKESNSLGIPQKPSAASKGDRGGSLAASLESPSSAPGYVTTAGGGQVSGWGWMTTGDKGGALGRGGQVKFAVGW
jgi:hypothetical protein